jgi:hypothetical protein
MKFIVVQKTPMVSRKDLAALLCAISPVAVVTDFECGYAEALRRVGLAYGIEVQDDFGVSTEVTLA